MSGNGLHRIRWRRAAVTRLHRTHLVSVRENDESYMRMALRTTYISCVVRLFRLVVFRTTYSSCVARLFGLMRERYFLCLSPTDFRLVRLTLARMKCLNRIRSSLFAKNVQPPRSSDNILLPASLIKRFAPFPVPVAIRLNPPAGEDNPTRVGCIEHVLSIAGLPLPSI